MDRPPAWASRLAMASLAAVLGANIYRACTQSITSDEAYTYNLFLNQGIKQLFARYDAAHHVLNTYLCQISIALFGVSELSMRLPSLAGGALYLLGLFRLSGYLFASPAWFLLSIGLLALNPFVLDHLSAARGYGSGLACLIWAFYFALRYLDERRESLLYGCGLCLGLAVAFNLVFAFPAAGLGAMLALLLIRQSGDLWRLSDHLAVPAIVSAFLFVILPLGRAETSNFYAGEPSLNDTLRGLMTFSFHYHPERSIWLRVEVPIAAVAVLGTIALAVAVRSAGRRPLLLVSGSMAVTFGLIFAAHQLFGTPYPMTRTAIYWIPLSALAATLLAAQAPRPVRIAGYAILLACALQFAIQFQVESYAEWRYDAGSKRVIARMREYHALHPRENVAVRASWLVESSLNFYRQMHNLTWMEPVKREDFNRSHDYFVLLPHEQALVGLLSLRVIYRDSVSGAVFAVLR
ncbi:MAG: glycosyltransferase family 39 protein [Bryobacteraceae bacterium]